MLAWHQHSQAAGFVFHFQALAKHVLLQSRPTLPHMHTHMHAVVSIRCSLQIALCCHCWL